MVKTRNASLYYSDTEDRISRLPDALIHHIMSFIDTKYAVQTSVLSKRWIHIWKSLPCLNFKRSSFSHANTERFIEFIYMVFLLRGDTNIQMFNVDWEESAFDNTVITNVNRWSLHAVKYNVQEINIIIEQLHNNSAYEIPHSLLNCKSLRKLEIQVFYTPRYVDFVLPISMNLPQLKELYLYGVSISNVELSKRLFSSCPVLHTLDIVDCDIQTDNVRRILNVDSLTLKRFEYAYWSRQILPQNDTMANIIKLCAPNLEEFTCRSFWSQDYSLEICSPLSSVCFHMFLEEKIEDENAETYSELLSEEKDVYAKRVIKFLGAVYMVKHLSLSSGFLEVLSWAPSLLNCQPPRLCNLQSLMLQMWSTRGCLQAIAYLLKISPNITQLFVESKKSSLANIGDDWEAELPTLPHLKYVKIKEVEGCDAEFKLLSFLLKNVKVLELVAVFFRSNVGSRERKRKVTRFKNKLKALPTASSNIEMMFLP